MYYYETLSSIDYRGSMTSLQSCQSAFSNISKASLKNNQHEHSSHKHRHSDDQHSMTSGISSGGMSQSTDGGNGVKNLYHHGDQSYSVIPAVTVLPPTTPGTPSVAVITTPVSSSNVSSESSTVHTISGSSDGSNNPTSKGKG